VNAVVVYQPRRPDLFHYAGGIVSDVTPLREFKKLHNYKPHGFWVSVDEPDEDGQAWGWKQWCEAEQYEIQDLRYRHRVIVRDTERLLWIVGEAALLEFDREYGLDQPYPRWRQILWGQVAEDYAGIVIAPYVWEQRLEMMWYYGWDCASGCIWDTSIIERIEVASE
jgi:hypothetical protein